MHGAMMRPLRGGRGLSSLLPLFFVALLLLARPAAASVGDQLPEFRECVEVRPPGGAPAIPATSFHDARYLA